MSVYICFTDQMTGVDAQTHASAHEIELKVNGVRHKGNLPNLVGNDYQKNKGDLWKISVA